MKLRKIQVDVQRLFHRCAAKGSFGSDVTVVSAVPGSGKSSLPVIAAAELMPSGMVQKIGWLAPRLPLKRQGAQAFGREDFRKAFGHALEIMEADGTTDPSKGTAGFITTYQAVDANPNLYAEEMRRYRYLLVLDEPHHLEDGGKWHRSVLPMFHAAAHRLLMSGTLDRGDRKRIAFLDYQLDGRGRSIPVSDIVYGMRDAIEERAVIQSRFRYGDGRAEWLGKDDRKVTVESIADPPKGKESDCVWVALNTGYADHLLRRCLRHWEKWARAHSRSKMLVVCYGIEQAKAVHRRLKRAGYEVEIATMDDSERAQAAIKRAREEGGHMILVTVQMAYEGLDVPDFTHLCCLTHIRSFPWLFQMFGRNWRYDTHPSAGPWSSQRAFNWVPDDPEMRKAVEYIKKEQLLGLGMEGNGGCGGGGERTCVPLSGELTREREGDLSDGEGLGHDQTSAVQAVMDECGIVGSPLDMVAAAQMVLRPVPVSKFPTVDSVQAVPMTPQDRVKRIRDWIKDATGRLDKKRGCPPGTTNRAMFYGVQGGKPRNLLPEAKLLEVRQWLLDQLRAEGMREGDF